VEQVQSLYQEFLAEHIEQAQREAIWERAAEELNQAFTQFTLEGLSLKNAESRQARFKQRVEELLRTLLVDSLSALDSEQLERALKEYVNKQQEKWQTIIGEEQYRNYQRLLLLSAIDTEWRDYLTAMDDLRREVGLEAIGQRDPKVQYKRRSYEMFADMRHNIDKGVADRFFREIAQHQQFIQQQQAQVAYQLQAQEAGFQVVKRERGKGVELRRDMPKVGRNDLCPCGSGKKYKNCHGRVEGAGVPATAGSGNGRTGQPAAGGRSSGRNKTTKTTAKKRKARR
jgi:preprotein translocase subunit SecA